MKQRKIVYIEFYSPWLSSGYSQSLISNNNKLFRAVGFIFRDNPDEIILGLGESDGQFLHQVSIPKGLIKGEPIELNQPFTHPELNENDKN